MYVQILKSKHGNTWYKNKINQIFEIDENKINDKMFFISKNELKKLKKARHLDMGILKEDCMEFNDEYDNTYDIDNIIRIIDGN